MKLCECGCGKPAPIAIKTATSYGHVKGQPVRFIRGHQRRFQGTLQERFEQFFEKAPNACWIWQGGTSKKDYGLFNTSSGHIKQAHRFSYELYKGPIPKGHNVCHKCDNPPCVNPDHLFAGTHEDNMKDRNNKKRYAYGKKNGQAKLTEHDVLNIRKDTCMQKEIAKAYGVAPNTISQIRSKKSWKHIEL